MKLFYHVTDFKRFGSIISSKSPINACWHTDIGLTDRFN